MEEAPGVRPASIPFLNELVPGGIDYGSVLLVEFEPQSCWYEAAYTMAAQSLRMGLKTDLHIFQHDPREVRDAVKKLGVDVRSMEDKDLLRFIDSFSVQVGVSAANVPKGADAFKTSSVRVEDWAKAAGAQISEATPESERNRIHIDDNTAVLTRYNKEDDVIDYWRTRIIPLYKERGGILVNAMALGVASESFYRQHESLADGIMDCKSQEVNGVMEHYVRMRTFRGKTSNSKWRKVNLLPGGEVALEGAGVTASPEPQAAGTLSLFLEGREFLDLARYSVAGSYIRYDDSARNTLKDFRSKVIAAFASGSPKHENYLLWAPPGSGKTSFVRQIASGLRTVEYGEINLAEADEAGFREVLAEVSASTRPKLVFVDEVDSKGNEPWPYEAMLTSLETDRGTARHVFILAGSSGSNIQEMKERMVMKPKGKDLLSRIPIGNEYSVPGMSLFDNVLVFLSCLSEAAVHSGKQIGEVEKLGLYYVATSSQLGNPRKLREFALRCAERVPVGDERLKYDSMFEPGDPVNKQFWMSRSGTVPKLVNSFLQFSIPTPAPVGREDRPIGVKAATGEAGKKVAVLPLVSMSPDASDEYFADGMTEELISSVSRTQGLRVIARTSVMKYKGSTKSISEIGKELGVGNVLEGSVRKAGDKVRITLQLVDTSNEEPIWSQGYDREIPDILAVQDDVARRVAAALRMHVLGSGAAKENANPEAYLNYLRGRQAWNKRTQEGLEQSIMLFQKCLDADSRYAKAYTGIADSYATLAILELVAPNEAFPKAKQAVERALALDPQLVEAHTSLGLIRAQYDWDWKGAEEEFRTAIDINPSYALAHHWFADFLKAMGRFDEALSEIAKAQELDPLNLAINTGVGHVLYLSKQYDKSIEQYRKAVELDPNFTLTHIWFGRPYLEKGMFDEAISELETAVKLSGEGTLALAMLGHGLASAGKKDEAQKVLQKLIERRKTRYVPSYWIAVVYNGFRDRDHVVEWLKKAYEERSSWLVWCNVEPRFDWLRGNPEFASLMKAMKFP